MWKKYSQHQQISRVVNQPYPNSPTKAPRQATGHNRKRNNVDFQRTQEKWPLYSKHSRVYGLLFWVLWRSRYIGASGYLILRSFLLSGRPVPNLSDRSLALHFKRLYYSTLYHHTSKNPNEAVSFTSRPTPKIRAREYHHP